MAEPAGVNCQPPDVVERVMSRSGVAVSRVRACDGRIVTIHSTVDPVAEAERLYGDLEYQEHVLTVVLGAGDGFHLPIVARSCGPVVAVERLAELAGGTAAQAVAVDILHGDRAPELVARIRQRAAQQGCAAIRCVCYRPAMRIDPEFYASIHRALKPPAPVSVESRLRYAKFTRDRCRVLILHSKYYLLSEITRALRRSGHEVRAIVLPCTDSGEGSTDFIEAVIAEIALFQPDFVLTVNHLGFDREGILTGFFTECQLPFASWYVDSPTFILDDFQRQLSPYLALFVWDEDYVGDLRQRGFERVTYLPLATDPEVFRPLGSVRNPMAGSACAVGFVGSSMTNVLAKCLSTFEDPDAAARLLALVAPQFAASSARYPAQAAVDLDPEWSVRYARLMRAQQQDFEPAITWAATQHYRLRCLRALLPHDPHVYGDPGWHDRLGGACAVHPELNYYTELPGFYNVCTLNFNTTSMQMKSGFNQRVFDVPACNAFVLTDYRRQLEQVFDIGTEIICYRDVDEIPELVARYLAHPAERLPVVAAARRRVLAEHTYQQRTAMLIASMRTCYG